MRTTTTVVLLLLLQRTTKNTNTTTTTATNNNIQQQQQQQRLTPWLTPWLTQRLTPRNTRRRRRTGRARGEEWYGDRSVPQQPFQPPHPTGCGYPGRRSHHRRRVRHVPCLSSLNKNNRNKWRSRTDEWLVVILHADEWLLGRRKMHNLINATAFVTCFG